MKQLFSLFVCSLLLVTNIWAQSLSDSQVLEYVKTATAEGKSQNQIIKELGAKGVTRAQAERIKQRYEALLNSQTSKSAVDKNRKRYLPKDTIFTAVNKMDRVMEELEFPIEQNDSTANRMIFGRNIFNTKKLTFAPSQNLATPDNYKIGPGDEIIIDIWGTNQNTIRQNISPDGYINIENLGLVYLSGMTIKNAESYLRKELNKIYSSYRK